MSDDINSGIEVVDVVDIEIETEYGAAIAQIIITEQNKQANIYWSPNGGASFFALFPLDEDNSDIEQALLPILNGEPLESDIDISDEIENCIVAGTVKIPTVQLAS